jgi:hypothetical protein
MSYTFGTATLDLAKILTDVLESAATADGAAGKTTLVDNALPITAPVDDHFNQGTIFFRECTNAALEGTSAIVTDFATAAGVSTYTFAAAAAQTKAADTYAVITNNWPRYLLRQAVNAALHKIGDVDQQDITVPTVANQLAYTLPTGVFNVKKVEQASSATAPLNYVELSGWEEIEGEIQFLAGKQPGDTGYLLRLTYNIGSSEITADATAIASLIHPEWLKWTAAVIALRWRVDKTKDDDTYLKQRLNEALQNEAAAERKYRPLLKLKPQAMQSSVWAVPGTSR